jgi:Tfp pilus assembly protein PilP
VAAPDGKSYSVSEGTTIGLYHGKTRRITRDSVVVSELLKDYRGKVKPKSTVLKLHPEEE